MELRGNPILLLKRATRRLIPYLLALLLATASACSDAAPVSPNASAPPNASASGQGEWAMEGYSLARDRATADDVRPPLQMEQEFTVGGDTQHGSPVGVARGLLFVEGAGRLHVLALDDGKERWAFNLAGTFLSPAVAGNRVFVRAESGAEGYVFALEADSGLKLWQFKFPRVGSSYGDFGGHVTSPVVAEGLVLVGASQSLYALDVDTGAQRWAFDAQNPVASSATVAGDTVYVTDFTRLYAIDLETGVESWSFEYGMMSLFFAPVVVGDAVIVTSYDTVYALDRDSGDVVWARSVAEDEDVVPSGAAGDHVYVKTSKHLYALDRETGALVWSYQAGDFISLPTVAGGQIYVVTRSGGRGQLRALRLSDGQEIWRIEDARLANAAPVVAGARVYVRTVDGSVLVYAA
jgi:outer membrane protein assembly factor BamB